MRNSSIGREIGRAQTWMVHLEIERSPIVNLLVTYVLLPLHEAFFFFLEQGDSVRAELLLLSGVWKSVGILAIVVWCVKRTAGMQQTQLKNLWKSK